MLKISGRKLKKGTSNNKYGNINLWYTILIKMHLTSTKTSKHVW